MKWGGKRERRGRTRGEEMEKKSGERRKGEGKPTPSFETNRPLSQN